MLIKDDRKLQIGQIINYPVPICDIEKSSLFTIEKLDIVVTEVYPHHVLFRCIKYPHKKVDVTNVDLWLKGIYQKSDRLLNTKSRKYSDATPSGIKFFDKAI